MFIISINRYLIQPRYALILVVLLVMGMFMGSVYDWNLSQTVFNLHNPFGVILAAYGQFPAAACGSLAGVIFIATFDVKDKTRSILLALLGIFVNGCGLAQVIVASSGYLSLPIPALVAIATVLFAACDGILLYVLRGVDNHALRRFAAFLLFVVLVQLAMVHIVKVVWARPRMRLISSTQGVEFQPWWIINSGQRETFMSLGIASEEFKSFPSGHTSSAACIMAVVALPAIKPQLARWSSKLFWGSAFATAVVASSRIIMGAHFLTDVTAGFAITFAVLMLGVYLFWKNRIVSL